MPDTRTNLLVVDDNMLYGMLRDPRYTQILPCLASAQRELDTKLAQDCGRCGKKTKQQVHSDIMRQVRNCLATMPKTQRDQFKQLSNARQVRVVRVNPNGSSVKVTF